MAKIKLFLTLMLFANSLSLNNDFNIPTGENFITGEDGIKRMYVNVWGHVKYPGTYLVYEDIDILTLLSIAGGPLDGAKLSSIKIMSKDNNSRDINLESMLTTNRNSEFKFRPYDTINIQPTLGVYLRDNAYVLNVFLQLITLGVTINNN